MRGEGGSKERKLLHALLSLVSMRGRLRGRVKCGRSEGEWRGGEAARVGEEKAELQAGQLKQRAGETTMYTTIYSTIYYYTSSMRTLSDTHIVCSSVGTHTHNSIMRTH